MRATLAELRAALDEVNRRYLASDFALSRAFIPAQAKAPPRQTGKLIIERLASMADVV